MQETQIFDGDCLDAGCGTGALGRAVAQISGVHVMFFDQSPHMLQLAQSYVYEERIAQRSRFLQGDIHHIPLASCSMDLVISRGSSPFWENQKQAYSEIVRVLRKGGRAFVGGGFGNAELRERIVNTMLERNPDWNKSFKERSVRMREALPDILKQTNPSWFEIINDESGFWAHICK